MSEIKEIWDSAKDSIKNRLNSPLYGTLAISWLIFHWELIYTAFFVDQKAILFKTGLLKNEYLKKTFFNLADDYFYISLILSLLLTWLILYVFPKYFEIPAFAETIKNRTTKRNLEIEAETALKKSDTEKLVATKENIETEKKIQILWTEEFIDFKKSALYEKFSQIPRAIYTNNGYIGAAPEDIMAYCHANGLIELNPEKNTMTLTEKGKFFISQSLIK